MIEELIKYVSGNQAVGLLLAISLSILSLFICAAFILAFFQGREISFWPPKIGGSSAESGKDSSPYRGPKNNRIITESPACSSRASPFLADLIESIIKGRAGIEFSVRDHLKNDVWVRNLLNMLREVFVSRAADVQVTWLRPTDQNPNELMLYSFAGSVDAVAHHAFARGEGFAGKVWQRGESAASSRDLPHPWWVFRVGCANATYLCAPIGGVGSHCGVLAVGSDAGFIIDSHDLRLVEIFAGVLGMSCAGMRPNHQIGVDAGH